MDSNNQKTNFQKTWQREEIRGLFVLGVIAALLSGEKYYKSFEVKFGYVTTPATFWAALIIVFWGLYAFFMIFSVSDDLFSRDVCNIFSYLSRLFLFFGTFALLYFTIFLFIIGYLDKLWLILLPLIPPIILSIFLLLKKIREIKIKIEKINIYETSLFLTGILFSFTFAMILASFFTTYWLEIKELPFLSVLSFIFSSAYMILYVYKEYAGGQKIKSESSEPSLCEMSAYFEIYKDRAGEYRWRLKAPNHKIIAVSGEGYDTEQGCREGIADVKRYAPDARLIEKK